ncbi:MAG TPA: ABC transporter ATP-binding protein [Solirubrobacteraceae bacterium]
MNNPALDSDSDGEVAVSLGGVRRCYALDGGRSLVALAGVDLSIARGSVVAITGPSGSGKSTLLHVIGALEVPDEGRVVVDGQDLRDLSRRELADHRRRLGFVFQGFHLLPALSVADNVIAPVLPVKTAFDKRARSLELLTAVGLEGRARSLPSRLSGGQQQRVAIARALINAPALVLADEPTGNLDSVTGAEIIELLVGLRARDGVTVVIATHDLGVAERCDRVVALRDGRVVADIDVATCADLPAAIAAAMRRPPGE